MTQQPRNPYGNDQHRRQPDGEQYRRPAGADAQRRPSRAAADPRCQQSDVDPRQRQLGADSRRQQPNGAHHQQNPGSASRQRASYRESQSRTQGARPRMDHPQDAPLGARQTARSSYNHAAGTPGRAQASYNQMRAQAGRAQVARAQAGQPHVTGTTEYSDYSRYVNQRKQRRKKSPVAIAVSVLLLVGIGVGVYFVLNPLSFDITVNGVKHTVDRGATLETVLDEGMATPKPGNLLAIDGSVAQEGGGDKFAATVNGEATTDVATKLKKNDAIEITNGADVTETFQSSTEEVPYQRVEDDNYWNGSLHIYIKGVNGVRTTKTGDVSGVVLTEDTQPVVNEEYRIYTANTGGDKVIALTFDDGPWPETTEAILDILDQYDAKATFFTIGNQIADHTSTMKRAHDAGHQICTHTWDHAAGSGQGVNLTYMSAEEQINEVQKGIEAIKSVIGTEPSHIMRAPGGNFHGDIVWTLEPYITAEIGWDVDTEDWRRPGADTIAQRILKAQPGDVVLMHDGGGPRSQTVEALKQALPALKEQGYRFVTVDELLAYDVPSRD